MRIKEIINEGMSFTPSRVITRNDGQQVHTPPGSRQQVDCFLCHGAGENEYPDHKANTTYKEKCGYCNGTGKSEEWVGEGPEMAVSNSNGMEIQRMMGLEPDYGGGVDNKDLPVLMRKLMMLKNGDTSAFTKDQTTDQGKMRATKNDDDTTSIGRGATVMDMGRSQAQVSGYVDRLMKLVKWCIDNGYDLSWA